MFIFGTSPINLNCTHFSENNCICDSVHQHVKDEKYSHCNQFGKLLQDPYKYALYKTSETIEISNKYTCNNYRDVPVDSSNPDRHESMNTEEESCKSKDYEKCLYLHYNITQNQTLYREKKHRQGEYDDYFVSAYCLLQQQIYIGETGMGNAEDGSVLTQTSLYIIEYILESNPTSITFVTNSLPSAQVLKHIKEFMLGRKLMDAKNVETPLLKNQVLTDTSFFFFSV